MKRWYPRLILFVGLACLFIYPASAQYLGTETEPPRLRDLEPMVVQIIYVVWGLGTLALTIVLMLIGFRYMTSMGDAQKQQQIKEGATNWIVSLLIFFLAYPVILGIYEITGISSDVKCYEDIATPGFKFFFPTVCTDPQAGSDKYSIGATCVDYEEEELNIIDSRGSCCRQFASGALIIPEGEPIVSLSDKAIAYIYESSSTGRCSTSPTSCKIGIDDGCDPVYEIKNDSGAYTIEKYVKPTVCEKYPSSLACRICNEGTYNSANDTYELGTQSYKAADCRKADPISGYE